MRIKEAMERYGITDREEARKRARLETNREMRERRQAENELAAEEERERAAEEYEEAEASPESPSTEPKDEAAMLPEIAKVIDDAPKIAPLKRSAPEEPAGDPEEAAPKLDGLVTALAVATLGALLLLRRTAPTPTIDAQAAPTADDEWERLLHNA